MKQTDQYGLNQWDLSDRIRMEDFNADNAKIDAALKAEADARTAADIRFSVASSGLRSSISPQAPRTAGAI